ncbi:MAG TPA: bifunctional phosphopantothenoylcysteine decarboxylase/phosphopantothenate--cysteine ligase CoaBC [Candidatus Latescibacteria bacterium]|nr:bifunctional phosphopantothenoylcysteine decarboxylase/phosphopantothenate--cysteine ligase CoaBC [Candidatus Latescibacterota bacterium]
MWEGRRVLVGVTGGIAAYKAAELVRGIRRRGAQVKVVMTRAATEFVSPLTFETLSGNEVSWELFPKGRRWEVGHIRLAEWAEVLVVAPATANFLGKAAGGIADDLLTTVVLAARCPVVVVPAMDAGMWANPVVQNNVEKLKELGHKFVGPEEGELASGLVGKGRLAKVERILEAVGEALAEGELLAGRRVLVTAGRTEEDLDPVRFLTNRSTGKMGYALAEVARRMGAEVVLVSGPTYLEVPWGVEVVRVRTTEEMRDAVLERFPGCDVLAMAAAVADFRPVRASPGKIRKQEKFMLELEKTPDILAELAGRKEGRVVVGFAVETEDEVERGREKLKGKNLDLIVVNNPLVEGAGFGWDTNVVTLIDCEGKVEELPKMSKRELAGRIWRRVARLLEG